MSTQSTMSKCPACGQEVEDLDQHIESNPDCLRAVEMGLVEESDG
jgi:endogenous inhibitor of DNA gyrase (YacG/DUF329 family)